MLRRFLATDAVPCLWISSMKIGFSRIINLWMKTTRESFRWGVYSGKISQKSPVRCVRLRFLLNYTIIVNKSRRLSWWAENNENRNSWEKAEVDKLGFVLCQKRRKICVVDIFFSFAAKIFSHSRRTLSPPNQQPGSFGDDLTARIESYASYDHPCPRVMFAFLLAGWSADNGANEI